jgi:hypothetical protein
LAPMEVTPYRQIKGIAHRLVCERVCAGEYSFVNSSANRSICLVPDRLRKVNS